MAACVSGCGVCTHAARHPVNTPHAATALQNL